MTGAFDYIVRVVASDMAGIERFVMTRLATIDGVRDVSTSITFAARSVQDRATGSRGRRVNIRLNRNYREQTAQGA
ncbi:Lrp/AsnC ligand binding domain-containing protein, partial [Paraburkholderia xenovorans]|uniref:Lrp/AsnC ligand binding domain-containing protein n=1 Tax=Paraburkholderia xenovorans TaxID=36873 RepID=UPI0038B88F67